MAVATRKLPWHMADSPHPGEIIQKLLDLHRMSNADLARALDIHRQNITDYISGKSVPGLSRLIEISRIFDVSLSVFGDPEVERDRLDKELRMLPPEQSEFFLAQIRQAAKQVKKIGKVPKDKDG